MLRWWDCGRLHEANMRRLCASSHGMGAATASTTPGSMPIKSGCNTSLPVPISPHPTKSLSFRSDIKIMSEILRFNCEKIASKDGNLENFAYLCKDIGELLPILQYVEF